MNRLASVVRALNPGAIPAALIAIAFTAPMLVSPFGLLQLTILAVMGIYALSQGFVWGYAGIMSFGQAAFMGLGAYGYSIAVLNLGDSTFAVLAAILLPMAFAALLGYFMFYGRISDAYVAVITLTVSVILFQLINATSGPQYRVGSVPLGGFNGIPAVPVLNPLGEPGVQIDQRGLWIATMVALAATYGCLRFLLATRFGRVVVAIRENEVRAQLLGYDPRLYKLAAFVVGAGVAGLAGCLYVNWAGYISPGIFALTMSAQAIVFVLVGGMGTLAGPIVGAVIIQWLINAVGDQRTVQPGLVLGVILVFFVLVIPRGIVPVLRMIAIRLGDIGGRPRAEVTPVSEAASANTR